MKRTTIRTTAPGPSPLPFVKRAVLALVWAERIVFVAIGVLLFAAALLFLSKARRCSSAC